MFGEYDLTTAGGITALMIMLTIGLTELIKRQWFSTNWPHYGLVTYIIAVVFAFGLTLLAIMGTTNATLSQAVGNALVAIPSVIAAYESIKNTLKAVKK